MLNVATTRAKHSFIVFGNMQIFQPHQNVRRLEIWRKYCFREKSIIWIKSLFILRKKYIEISQRIK